MEMTEAEVAEVIGVAGNKRAAILQSGRVLSERTSVHCEFIGGRE
jgi:hypothetical protein